MASDKIKVALVTGAGSGIGRAIAIALAEVGYSLVLVGRRLDRLTDTAGLLPNGTEHLEIAADVGDATQVSGIIDQTIDRFARLDVLVNNAGFAPLLPIEKMEPEILDEVYRVNALAVAYAIAKAWPIFIRRHRLEGTGSCIINISTLGTVDPFAGFFGYAAAKAAVNSMVRSCAREGVAFGVRAFAVAPGAVETEMFRALFKEADVPKSACLSSTDVAQVVLECVSGSRDEQNGETIFVTKDLTEGSNAWKTTIGPHLEF